MTMPGSEYWSRADQERCVATVAAPAASKASSRFPNSRYGDVSCLKDHEPALRVASFAALADGYLEREQTTATDDLDGDGPANPLAAQHRLEVVETVRLGQRPS